jgi:predicted amidophosphoribosyltransferase
MSWPHSGPDRFRAAPELGAGAGVPCFEGLLAPQAGWGVCDICFNLVGPSRTRCRACLAGENHLDAVAPISYSVNGSRLHREIAAYKRDAEPFVGYAVTDLAAILEGFLSVHEMCVGGGERFDVVTTVPSSDQRRDEHHQLRRIVAELVPAVRARHQRLLQASGVAAEARSFDRRRYEPLKSLSGQRVLLIDDMWTTGASAQSAAAVLRDAGASYVAAVVIGRHLNREYSDNQVRLARLGTGFSWSDCVLCKRSGPALDRL